MRDLHRDEVVTEALGNDKPLPKVPLSKYMRIIKQQKLSKQKSQMWAALSGAASSDDSEDEKTPKLPGQKPAIALICASGTLHLLCT